MACYLVTFLLFFLQFIYFPIGTSYFESPKVYLTELCIFILLLLQLFVAKFSFKIYNKKTFLSLILLVIVTLVDVLFFAKPTTFFGNTFRLQGVFLLWQLAIFAFLSATISLPKLSPKFFASIIALQLLVVLFIAGGINERAVGSLGEPNALSAAVIFIWPFLVFSKEKPSRFLVIFSIVVTALIIFLSGSRSGMIALGIQLLFWALTRRFGITSKVAVISCLVIMILSYALPFADQTNVYERRSDIWNVASAAGVRQPVLGYGFGNVEYALHDTARVISNNLGTSYVDSSHNIFLDWFIQGGIIGLGILLFLLFQTFVSFIRKQQNRDIVLLLGLLTALSFNPASIVSLVAFWWLLGQGMGKRE